MSDGRFAGLGRAALVTGTVSALLSTVGLAVAAEAEGVAPLRPINATSHWLNGDFAGLYGGVDGRRTGVGALTNHGACLFWALAFTAWQRARPAESAGALMRDGLAMAAVAAAGRRSASRPAGNSCCPRPAWRAPMRPWRSASRRAPRSTEPHIHAEMRQRGFRALLQIPAGDGMVLDNGRRGTRFVPDVSGPEAARASVGETPFDAHLLTGERFIWTGVPRRGLVFGPQDAFLVPFSLFWCGFSIFWVVTASRAGGVFGLFGLPFVTIGLFMVFGRFMLDAWLRTRTAYAVTDRRILIYRAAPFASFTSIELLHLPEVKLSGVRGDRGTLRFGPPTPSLQSGNMATSVTSLDPTPQFIGIERPNEILRLILEASEGARWPGGQPSR